MTEAPTYYSFRPDTGEFAGEGNARFTWHGAPEEWIFPGHSTTEPPPATEPGFVAVRDGDKWAVVPDHRGETWYSTPYGQPVEIVTIGVPVGAVAEAPPDAKPGEAMVWKDGAWQAEADHRGEVWFTADGEAVTVTFIGDPVSVAGLAIEPPDHRTDNERLSDAKTGAAQTIVTLIDQAPGALWSYPQAERASWPAKEAEARSYLAGQTTWPATIAAEVLAESNSESMELFRAKAERIVAKADELNLSAARLAGIRQKYQRQIDSASSLIEIETIVSAATGEIQSAA